MSEITFIGGGNMATAIVEGLIASGAASSDITIVDPNADKRAQLEDRFGVTTTGDIGAACKDADTIVLAVKPQTVSLVAQQAKEATDLTHKLLISIAAGVTVATLQALFGEIAIARSMPNTPAILRMGATGLYVNAQTTEAQRAKATEIIEAFGICVAVEQESQLNTVTAVSGSGPAYFYLLIEEMIRTGEALGLSNDDAKALTLQTALGAASMAAKGDVDPTELRHRVTSPNGTTHAAITCMQQGGYGKLIEKAMTACRDRAVELGKG